MLKVEEGLAIGSILVTSYRIFIEEGIKQQSNTLPSKHRLPQTRSGLQPCKSGSYSSCSMKNSIFGQGREGEGAREGERERKKEI